MARKFLSATARTLREKGSQWFCSSAYVGNLHDVICTKVALILQTNLIFLFNIFSNKTFRRHSSVLSLTQVQKQILPCNTMPKWIELTGISLKRYDHKNRQILYQVCGHRKTTLWQLTMLIYRDVVTCRLWRKCGKCVRKATSESTGSVCISMGK